MVAFFKNNKEPENLKDILKVLKGLEKKIDDVFGAMEKIKQECARSLQKTGIVRFNPFSEVGGDQSFSIALLDKQDSGVVITSLYTRDGNRVYAKPIQNGTSEYTLSKEEKEVLSQATGS